MASKYHLENNLIYLDGTDIPHNKLGITDSVEWLELESELLAEAYQMFSGELVCTQPNRQPDRISLSSYKLILQD